MHQRQRALHLEALQDLIGLAALHVHDESDAAGVVFEPRIVEALLGRQARAPPRLPAGLGVIVSVH
jgi:hypothetical protein